MIDSSGPKAILASILIFSAVIGNASVFGLLKTRPAIWLGDISYGIYLIHGLILWLSYNLIGVPSSFPAFIVFAIAVGTTTVLTATLSYLKLELPIMKLFKPKPKPIVPIIFATT